MTEQTEARQIVLVPLTDDERRRVAHSPIFGYIRARGTRIPFESWEGGVKLFISNNNDSIRRTIYRSAAKHGIVVSCETVDGRDALYTNLGPVSSAKPATPRPLTREWDAVMSVDQIRMVRDRRKSPDGVERPVKHVMRGGVMVRSFPWAQLREGDFFVVPLQRETGREIRSLKNGFRDAANRYDYEIQVSNWNLNIDGEETPGLRVAMIQRGLADLKRRAAHRVGAIPVISKGRKVRVPKTRQNTLIKVAVAACLKAGVNEEKLRELFPEYNFEKEEDHGPRAVQENRPPIVANSGLSASMGTDDEAEEVHEFVLGAGYELPSVPHLDLARDATTQQDHVLAKRKPRVAEDRDAEAHSGDSGGEPSVLGRQFRHGELTEVATVDYGSEIDVSALPHDNPLSPHYDRRRVILERAARAAGEDA